MSDASNKLDPYAPWRIRDYRCYACSWFAIMFSKQIETLAVSVYLVSIFDKTSAPLALGAMGLVQALPVMLLAIAGGQMADRLDRQRIMTVMLALGCLSIAGQLIVAMLGLSWPWIFVMLGLGAVSQSLGSPARAALLPELVPAEIFSNAVAWNSSVFYIASVTGPVVCGFVLTLSKDSASAFENPVPALALALACRAVSLVAIAMVRHRSAARDPDPISWASVAAGARFVWHTKLILATITMDLFAVLLGGATYLLPIFAKDILHVGSTGLGLLRAADAIGAVCMAMLLAHLPPMRRAGITLLWAVAGYGAATIIFGFSQWFWLSMLMMFLVGALDNISVVVRHTLVQMLTPDAMRGRVSAINSVFIVASNDIGGLESGLTAWLLGPVISVAAGGAGTILVVLGALWIWPQILSIGALNAIRPDPMKEPPDIL